MGIGECWKSLGAFMTTPSHVLTGSPELNSLPGTLCMYRLLTASARIPCWTPSHSCIQLSRGWWSVQGDREGIIFLS